MIEIIKSKSFWTFILIGSIVSTIFSLLIKSDYDLIKESTPVYVCKFNHRFERSAPALRDLGDSLSIKLYKDLVENITNNAPPNISGIEYNKIVYKYKVYEKHDLSLVIVQNNPSSKVKKPIYKCWISNKFLSEVPCD